MAKEKLDALFTSGGAIPQEDGNTMAKSIQAEPVKREPGSEKKKLETAVFDDDRLEKIIQSKVDKITSRLGKEKADLQKQLEKLKKEKLTGERMKQIELSEKVQEIAQCEKSLKDRENRLYAMKAIKAAGLDDGSDKALSLVEVVLGEDETDIDGKVRAVLNLVKGFVQYEAARRFWQTAKCRKRGSCRRRKSQCCWFR